MIPSGVVSNLWVALSGAKSTPFLAQKLPTKWSQTTSSAAVDLRASRNAKYFGGAVVDFCSVIDCEIAERVLCIWRDGANLST